jgi:hypothetical protein
MSDAYDDWMVKTGDFARNMTLRDHFAGLAMQGLIASPRGTPDGKDATDQYYAKCAYIMADAMLKERANEIQK